MSKDETLTLTVRIDSDGSALVGDMRLSREELDKLSKGAKDASKELKDVSKELTSFQEASATSINAMHELLAVGAGLIMGSVGAVINAGAEFEASMAELAAITGATGQDFNALQQSAKDFSLELGDTASNIAKSFTLMASAKPELLSDLNALKAATKEAIILSQAAGMSTQDAVTALGNSLNQFGVGAEEASRYINVLAAGAKLGSSVVNDTAAALKNAGTEAAAAGIQFEQANAMVQVLAEVGIKASEAGMGIRNVVGILTGSGKKLEDIGISAASVNPEIVGLETAFKNLAAANLTSAQYSEVFGIENKNAARQLIENVDKINQLTTALTGTNVAYEQAEIRGNTTADSMEDLGAKVNLLAVVIYERFKPAIQEMVEWLDWLLDVAITVFEEIPNLVYALAGTIDKAWEDVKYVTYVVWESIRFAVNDTYEAIRAATVISVAFLEKKFAYIAAAFEHPLDFIKNLWNNFMSWMTKKASDFASTLADLSFSADFLPGMTEATSQLTGVSAQLSVMSKSYERAATEGNKFAESYNNQVQTIDAAASAELAGSQATQEYSGALEKLNAEREQAKNGIDEIVTDLMTEATATTQATKATEELATVGTSLEKSAERSALSLGNLGEKTKDTKEKLSETEKALNSAREAVTNLFATLEQEAFTAGWSEMEKKIDDVALALQAAGFEGEAFTTHLEYAQLLLAQTEFGENSARIKQLHQENLLLQESIGLSEVQREQMKAVSQLASDILPKESAEYQSQKNAIEQITLARLRLDSQMKAGDTLKSLQAETAAISQGTRAYEEFKALKELGAGGTRDQASVILQGQAIKQYVESATQLRAEFDLLRLNNQERLIEVERRKLGAAATQEQAAQIVSLNQALEVAQNYQTATTSIEAELSLLQLTNSERLIEVERRKLGATATQEQAAQILNLNQALETTKNFQSTGESLVSELELLSLSNEARLIEVERRKLGAGATQEQAEQIVALNQALESSNQLMEVNKNYEDSVKSLQAELGLLQLTNSERLIEVERRKLGAEATREQALEIVKMNEELKDAQFMDEIANKAGDMWGEIASGQKKAKDALKDFGKDILGMFQKQAAEKAKAQFMELFGMEAPEKKVADVATTVNETVSKATTDFKIGLSETVSKNVADFKVGLSQPITQGTGDLDKSIASNLSKLTDSSKEFNTTLSSSITNNVNTLTKAFGDGTQTLAQAIESVGKKAAELAPQVSVAAPEVSGSTQIPATIETKGDLNVVSKSANLQGISGSVEGLRIKGGYQGGKGQAVGGGKTQEATFALAQSIQKMLGDQVKYFSAFDDAYHHSAGYKARKQAAGQSTSSVHQTGRALDVVLTDAAKGMSTEFSKRIKDIGKDIGVNISTLDEYKVKTSGGTGGHIHVNFKSQADADKFMQFVNSGAKGLEQLSSATTTSAKAAHEATNALKAIKPAVTLTKESFKGEKATTLKAVTQAADKHGISQEDFLRFSYIETGGKFNANAHNQGSGAKGLFQFIPSTAKQYGIQGKEFDPFINANAGAQLYLDNLKQVKKLTSNITGADMYIAHQQGMGGYKSIQSALKTGSFSRHDTRRNILSNIGEEDIQKYAGVSLKQFKGMDDKAMAEHFMTYWKTKFNSIDVSQIVGTTAGKASEVLEESLTGSTQVVEQHTQALQTAVNSEEIAAQTTQLKSEADQIAAQASQMGVQAKTQETIASTQVAMTDMQQAQSAQTAAVGVEQLAQASQYGAETIVDAAQGMAEGAAQAGAGAGADAGGGGFLSNLFSGDGILGSIGSLFKGGGALESVGSAVSGLTGTVSGLVDKAKGFLGAGTGGVFDKMGGFGGIASAGMSLFSGDKAGAISGLASSLGTAIAGPLGGMVGNLLGGKVFGTWERESEWVRASIKGLEGKFDKGFKEVNKGWVGGGEKVGYEELDEATIKQLNETLGKTKDLIVDLSKAFGASDSQGLLKSMGTFSGHIEAMEDKGADWFAERMDEVQVRMLKHAVAQMTMTNVEIEDSQGIADLLQGQVSNIMETFTQVSEVAFDEAVRASTWSGDLDSVLGSGEANAKELHDKVTSHIHDFLGGMDFTQFKLEDGTVDLPAIQAVLSQQIASEFSALGVNDLPPETFDNFANTLVSQLGSALSGEFGVTEDLGFFKTLQDMTMSFDGTAEELSAFVNQMLGLRESFKLAGFDAGQISESLIEQAGSAEQLNTGMTAFYENFLSEEEKRQSKLTPLVADTSKEFERLGMEMPKSKEAFRALVEGVGQDLSTEEAQKQFATLVNMSGDVAELFELQAQGVSAMGNALDGSQQAIDGFISNLSGLAQSITTADIGSALMDSLMNAKSSEEAGRMFAEKVTMGIQEAMLNTVVNSIAQAVMSGMVQPMLSTSVQTMTNMAQGGTIAATNLSTGGINAATNLSTGGVSAATNLSTGGTQAATVLASGGAQAGTQMTVGGSQAGSSVAMGGAQAGAAMGAGGASASERINAAIAQAKEMMTVMAGVMSDPEVKAQMDSLTAGLQDVGATAYDTFIAPTPSAMNNFNPQPMAFTPFVEQKRMELAPQKEQKSEESSADGAGADAGGAEEAAKEAEQTADTLKKLRESLSDFSTGLEGNELRLHQMANVFKDVDLSAYNLTGSSTEVAKSLNTLSDGELQSIASQAGIELEDLSGYVMDYVEILRDEEQALKDWREGLNEYTSAGEKNKELIKTLAKDVNGLGLSVDEAVGYAQNWSDAEIEQLAQQLDVTVDEFKEQIVPGVLEGLQEIKEETKAFQEWQQSLTSYTSAGDKTGQATDQLIKQVTDLGLSVDDAVGIVQSWDETELKEQAEALGLSADEFKETVIPNVLDGLKQAKEGFNDFRKSLTNRLFGSIAENHIKDISNWVMQLGVNSKDAAQWVLALSDADIAHYAEQLDVLPEVLTNEIVPGVLDSLDELGKGVSDFKLQMGEFYDGLTDGQRTLQSLNAKYPSLNLAMKMTETNSVELAKYLGGLSEQDWAGMAKDLGGVDVDELLQDAGNLVGAMKGEEEAAKDMAHKWVDMFNSVHDGLDTLKNNVTSAMDEIKGIKVTPDEQIEKLKGQVYGAYEGDQASIYSDPEELEKRIALAEDLRKAVVDRYNEEKDLLEEKHKEEMEHAKDLLRISKDMRETVNSLKLGDLSTLTHGEQLTEARRQYDELKVKAKGGDAEAAQKFIEMSKELLGKGREYHASGSEYDALFKMVTGDLDSLGLDLEAMAKEGDKPFEESQYAGELKGIQDKALKELETLNGVIGTTQQETTDVLANALVDLGGRFGVNIEELIGVLRTEFPELGDRLESVVANIKGESIPEASTQGVAVTDQQIMDYINQSVEKAGGVNAQSVGDIVTTAKEYGVDSARIAQVTGLSEQEVAKTAAQYGQEFNTISDQQILEFINQSVEKAGGINEQSVTDIINTAKDYGVTSAQVAEATGLTQQDILDYAAMYGLPSFAQGGYVDKPTIALVGEGKEGEYIIPESKLPQPNSSNTAEIERLLTDLLQAQQETQNILESMMSNDSQNAERTVSAIKDNTITIKESAKTSARLMSNKALALQGN
ncbi:MAG: hypothetical protein BWK79_00155 [Beggiatoa sp. IS2]|nr:MAG: hypothetical protein BWK78_00045 [Thiotrichaceae bacterium IS1]OQW96066.1 MAG: hypothetical protein BWK79_00155 [Beggiatoa sp. IS2]